MNFGNRNSRHTCRLEISYLDKTDVHVFHDFSVLIVTGNSFHLCMLDRPLTWQTSGIEISVTFKGIVLKFLCCVFAK